MQRGYGHSNKNFRVERKVLLNQIRSIDKHRLIKRLGVIKPETMARVNRAIEISLGLTLI